MADSSKLIGLAVVAGAGYLAYQMGWLAQLGLAPAAATPATPATGGTPAAGAAPAAPNVLDGVYAKVVAAAGGASAGVDTWNFYLGTAMQGVKPGFVPPDPMPIFQSVINGDRTVQLTAAQYWATMAPWLKQNTGLSGMGPRGLGWMAEYLPNMRVGRVS